MGMGAGPDWRSEGGESSRALPLLREHRNQLGSQGETAREASPTCGISESGWEALNEALGLDLKRWPSDATFLYLYLYRCAQA